MDKIPPQNIEFEQSILASCLLFRDQIDEIVDILSPDDFYRNAHGKIYQVIVRLYGADEPVDLNTVAAALKKESLLDVIGGASYLASLTDNPIATNPRYYADTIIEAANLRRIIEITTRYQQKCFEASGGDVGAVIDGIQSEILSIGRTGGKPDFVKMRDLIIPAIERYEAMMGQRGQLTGVESGYIDIDAMTCGFQPGDLVILAARPSLGKTALAVNSMLRAAKNGVKSAIFSLEMSSDQLINRVVSIASNINALKFRSGMFRDDDWAVITKASSKLYDLPIWIDDTANQTYQQIIRKTRRLVRQEDIKIIWIDYLGFVKGDASKKRVYEVGEISRSLKGLAKDLNIPVVLLCQLNRQCEQRPNKRPKLADLRESGDLEQDADIVMFLYRHEHYFRPKLKQGSPEWNEYHGVAELEIAKHRNGPTGTVNLAWHEETTEFNNFQPEDRTY